MCCNDFYFQLIFFINLEMSYDDEYVELDNYVRSRSKKFKSAGLPIDVTYMCEALLDKELFSSYEGDVYFHNTCFGTNFDGHLPAQNPIKISEGESTKTLTPREILNKITAGIAVYSDDVFSQYASNNLKPLYYCGNHKTLIRVRVCQFISGVLLLFTFF